MKFNSPWNNNQKLPPNRFQTLYQAPHQNNPQTYLKPTENPPSYRPNLLNQNLEPKEFPTSVKPRFTCHKYGLGNHYERDCQDEIPSKPKVKDSSYYTHRAQELAESEKTFVTSVS